jgi:hypothetical protein
MIISKLYRWRKLIICVMVILGVAFYFVSHTHLGNHIDTSQIQHTYTGLSYIKDSGVIDKEMVIKSLSSTQQLVGTEGHVTKTYIYSDSIFKEHGWLRDVIGLRSIEMDVNAFFKMGINLSDITQEDISVYGHTLFIKIPKQILISLDVPYDQIIFKTKTGLMRSQMSESEKQMLYTEARRLLTDNIMGDQTIIDKSVSGVEDALRNLLEKIPNCNRIVFKAK